MDKQDGSSTSSTTDPECGLKSVESMKCCFAVKPTGYKVFIQMGHAYNGIASIFIGKHTPTNHFVAIRQVPLEDASIDLEDIQNEIVMHRIFSSDHILNYLATFISGSTLWIVMPLQGYGSCMDMLQAHFMHGLPELVIALILKQVLVALEYLHSSGVIHRSLRSSHILVSETGRVMLSGLRNGYVLEKHGEMEEKCWHYPTNSKKSISYYSPEILMQDLHGYDQKSDIYSLGVVACELANGHTPFSNLKSYEILFEKLDGNVPRLLDETTTTLVPEMENNVYSTKKFSPEFHQFAAVCCAQDPSQRPSADELLKHKFFQQTKKVKYSELPSMLQPLTPLTESVLKNSENTTLEEPQGSAAVFDLNQDLSAASLSDMAWEF